MKRLALCAALLSLSCTPAQLATLLPVVQSVAELAKELCTEDDDALGCLKKCETEQHRRDAEK
jgi:hypothetical protein